MSINTTENLKEKVLKSNYKKVYNLDQIWKWVKWGMKKGVINRSRDKENMKNIIKWIEILNKNKNIDL